MYSLKEYHIVLYRILIFKRANSCHKFQVHSNSKITKNTLVFKCSKMCTCKNKLSKSHKLETNGNFMMSQMCNCDISSTHVLYILPNYTHILHTYCSIFKSIFVLCLTVESKVKPKAGSDEDLLLKKLKKKKKKKHKDGEREKERHSRPKMYHRSCQTVCSGVSLDLPEFLSRINGNNNNSSSGVLHAAAPHQDQQDRPITAPTSTSPSMVVERLSYSSPLHCTPVPGLPGLEFGRLIHIEQQANGGASVAHAYSEQLACLSPAEMQRFAQEFVTLSFSENEDQAACFVMGIIHGAASYLPDFLDYFSYNFPNAPVKMEVLGKKDIETTTMANFHSQVRMLFLVGFFPVLFFVSKKHASLFTWMCENVH